MLAKLEQKHNKELARSLGHRGRSSTRNRGLHGELGVDEVEVSLGTVSTDTEGLAMEEGGRHGVGEDVDLAQGG